MFAVKVPSVETSSEIQLGPVEGRPGRPSVAGGAALRGGRHLHLRRLVALTGRRRLLLGRERIAAGSLSPTLFLVAAKPTTLVETDFLGLCLMDYLNLSNNERLFQ